MSMDWLMNSIKVDIGRTQLFLATRQEIWEEVVERHSKHGNAAQALEIKTRIRDMKRKRYGCYPLIQHPEATMAEG